MKKFLVRVERAFVKAALSKQLRPIEHDAAVAAAKSLLMRYGASAATVAVVVELVNKYVA